MMYLVYRGEYPFNDVLGMVEAPHDKPEMALQKAINEFKHVDPHPAVEPFTEELPQ